MSRCLPISAALALGRLSLPCSASAQDSTGAAGRPGRVNGWLSLALGPAYDRQKVQLGTSASLWLSSRTLTAGARIAGATSFESGGMTDGSFLIGLRQPSDWATLLGAVGFGVSTSTAGCCDNGAAVGVLTYHGEAVASARYGGIGLSVFGALAPASRAYAAFGLTLDMGRIH